VRLWFRLDSNNALYIFLNTDCQYNHKLALACGLLSIPSRRTFDRRLKTMSTDIKQRISTMGYLFAAEGIVMVDDDHSIATAVDSTLMKAKGSIWHKSSMKKGIIPCSGIDTDARWGYSHTKGWLFGYKLHLTCTAAIDKIVVPLTADVTTANVPDNKMYIPLTSSSLVFSLPYVLYMIADPGYDAKKLYGYSKKTLGMDLVCPLLKDIKVLSKRGLSLYAFMNLKWGRQSTAREEYR
jgi:hypothetical protein